MKKSFLFALLTVAALSLAACGDKVEETSASDSVSVSSVEETSVSSVSTEKEVVAELEPTAEPEVEEVREGMYRSELTNEWIDESLKDQRPIAVMVDNESKALPHYGLNSADVVYELMNSTANGRITRLMCLVKDWGNLKQFGSVRSARPTNFMLAAEYNAILIHDGGPFYINDWVAKDYTNNLSGGFARFSNGKASEFTEYVTSEAYTNPEKNQTYAGLPSRIESAGYSKTYNDYAQGNHFTFSNKPLKLDETNEIYAYVDGVKLPYPHNSTELKYNADTQTYDYYEYGDAHVDPLDDNKIMSFKNAIILNVSFNQLDDNGYLIYNVISEGVGYYLSDGVLIPMYWYKPGENNIMEFQDFNTREPLVMNTGKTYITLCPSDVFDDVEYIYHQ